MADLHAMFATLWVLWFFLLFGGILLWVLRPSRREEWRRRGEMIFRDTENG